MRDPDLLELRAAYDAQLRVDQDTRLPEGVVVEHDGPLARTTGYAHGGFVGYRDLAGIEGDELDALIARQVAIFARRGESFEWKLHGHDLPDDLDARLFAAGFAPEDTETVEIARVSIATGTPVLPEGVTLRETVAWADLERIVAMEDRVWGNDGSALLHDLAAELAVAPDSLTIIVAEAGGEVVSAGWMRFPTGTEFATLWGGATLRAWRRKGIYRALVAYRANLAAARGVGYLQVDASDESRPILERIGFVPVTTTTPFVWSPAEHAGDDPGEQISVG
ncbi:MAG: GNAT family N-acetyltransferase [Gaiellales bacterium]